jgi:D-sedoheptulose 7-phosphate isomerase
MNIKTLITEKAYELKSILKTLAEEKDFLSSLSECGRLIVDAYKNSNKVLFCGNGGSASDAQHLAAELVGRFYKERKALNAESLSVNTSSITAIGNDYSFESIFSRQLEAKGSEGDVLVGLSTSGNSKNVFQAFKTAKSIGIKTILLTGKNKQSLIADISDFCIFVPSDDTPRIQETHIFIGHILCEYVENVLF